MFSKICTWSEPLKVFPWQPADKTIILLIVLTLIILISECGKSINNESFSDTNQDLENGEYVDKVKEHFRWELKVLIVNFSLDLIEHSCLTAIYFKEKIK